MNKRAALLAALCIGVAPLIWVCQSGKAESTDSATVSDAVVGAGLPVFDCEYALNYASTAYANSLDRGYVPYATRRSLSRLTTTPPPGY